MIPAHHMHGHRFTSCVSCSLHSYRNHLLQKQNAIQLKNIQQHSVFIILSFHPVFIWLHITCIYIVLFLFSFSFDKTKCYERCSRCCLDGAIIIKNAKHTHISHVSAIGNGQIDGFESKMKLCWEIIITHRIVFARFDFHEMIFVCGEVEEHSENSEIQNNRKISLEVSECNDYPII